MTMPLSFTPRFIGKLIKLAREYPRHSPIWFRLWIAVEQCREFNSGDMPREQRERFWRLHMLRTQQELAELGVVV